MRSATRSTYSGIDLRRCTTQVQCVLDSALALIPIDSAALAYQLADFKIIARRAGRLPGLTFFSFCLSSLEAIPPAGALVRTKNLPYDSPIGAY
jgi:hypothetical protein